MGRCPMSAFPHAKPKSRQAVFGQELPEIRVTR
jgi:hypothetical protein